MDLNQEVYYNIYKRFTQFYDVGIFYIGNGNIFLRGVTVKNFPGEPSKFIFIIQFINSTSNDSNNIYSNSYEIVEKRYYNSVEEAININEMFKIWNKYRNHKCEKQYNSTAKFNIPKGGILNKIKLKSFSLMDTIIFDKKIQMEDMKYIPFNYELRRKINLAYDKDIFDLNKFN
jgi:hypothetical protein